MKILVYGAGVIGTVYAARLQNAGHQVTVLARGARLAVIRHSGLVVEDVATSARSAIPVNVIDRLAAEDAYDLVIVAVRRDQLSGMLPELARNTKISSILFMLNNPAGSIAFASAIAPHRVLLGFPGMGGALQGEVVYYATIAQQPTTLGEPVGKRSARLSALMKAFSESGIPTRIDNNMNAWLMCHAFFITCVSGAIFFADGDCQTLSRSSPLLRLMVDGVRQGFSVARALGQPVHPRSLNVLFRYLPRSFAIGYWRRFFSRQIAEFIFARHIRQARSEVQLLAMDCLRLLERSSISAPALLELCRSAGNCAPGQEK